jgi:Tfp pilus assembly protein PilV
MIAAAVLAVGLAGLSALSLRSVIDTTDARNETTAALAAAELGALIRLVPSGMSAWTAPPGVPGESCAGPAACGPEDFAAEELARWAARLGHTLPGATTTVCRDGTPNDGTVGAPACDGAGVLWIKIIWPAHPAAGAGDSARLVTRVVP